METNSSSAFSEDTCNHKNVEEQAALKLKRAEEHRANARKRKAESRKRIMEDPERKAIALENARRHFKTHYNKTLNENAVKSLITERVVPARQKWDQAYSSRKRLLHDSSIAKNSSETLWLERPQEKREMYKIVKKAQRDNEKIAFLELKLQQAAKDSNIAKEIIATHSAVSKTEKQNFLIDEILMDAKFVRTFNDERLTYVYLEMLERSRELYGKSLSRNDVVTTIAAQKLCEAGSMMGGSGFLAVEACNAEAARACVFSPEEMVRVTVETSCNLSNLGHVAECQKNLEKRECGFMFKKTTITQAGLDAVEGNLFNRLITFIKHCATIILYVLIKGSIGHYCDNNSVESNFVKLKHRQIWEDVLSCPDILRDSKSIASFESGDVPTKRILLTVCKQNISRSLKSVHFSSICCFSLVLAI
jgi:hypothetical protein